jgi:hypothetical protein
MKHFRDEDWLDYVRGLSPPRQRAAIEQSLSEGCEHCMKLFNFWRKTVEVAVRDSGYQVPDEAIETATEAYAIWSQRYRLQATARRSRRVFDSFLQPAMAGFRGSDTASRRVIQRSGRWIIDLRLESEGNNRVSMAGQVLQTGEWTGTPAAGAVCVMNGEELLDRTKANQFSEFQLQFRIARNLKLYVEIEGERPILVNLPETIEMNPQDTGPSGPDDK